MSAIRTDRRRFLTQAAVAAATAGSLAIARQSALRAEGPAGGGKAIRLGGPVFDAPQEPEALALAHRKLGYRAAYCPDVSLSDGDRIRALREAFAKHDVVIAEVGRWVNLLDADPDKRAANLKRVTDGLAIRGGYDIAWLAGPAFAPAQRPSTDRVIAAGTVFFQGLAIGLEYRR